MTTITLFANTTASNSTLTHNAHITRHKHATQTHKHDAITEASRRRLEDWIADRKPSMVYIYNGPYHVCTGLGYSDI